MRRRQFARRTLDSGARSHHSLSTRAARRSTRLRLEPLEERLVLTTLPAGFSETQMNNPDTISGPTAMEISPLGELWVLEQSGTLKMVRTDGTVRTVGSLTVDSAGERGLLGIAFSPNYDGVGLDQVYLYYTTPRVQGANPPNPSNNQLGLFDITGAGTANPTLGAGTTIREFPPEDEDNNLATDGDTNHNGGAIHFGNDGKLYVGIGDHNYDTLPQSAHVSQILTTPFGKILRLNPDGTNPSDNPHYTGSATDWEGSIWAMGFRNPFTFAVDRDSGTDPAPPPGSGIPAQRIFINDVGESTWEEINSLVKNANYGWAGSNSPLYEGFETSTPWANYRNPEMAYDHSSGVSPAGSGITGGTFYPDDGPFGSAYRGKYFFSDLNGFIRVFNPSTPATIGTPDNSVAFASNLSTPVPVDLKVDAAGNLYYLARGNGGNTGAIYRISANAEVVGRNLFYNQSGFDGDNAAINSADARAIAPDKTAYLPGDGLAVFNNVSSYSRGINGIMIDVDGAGNHAAIGAGDFTFKMSTGNNQNQPQGWSPAPRPPACRFPSAAAWADPIVSRSPGPAARLPIVGWKLKCSLPPTRAWPPATFSSGAAGSAMPTATFGRPMGTRVLHRTIPATVRPVTDRFDFDRSGSITNADAGLALDNPGSLAKINIGSGGPFAPVGGGGGGSGTSESAGDGGASAAIASALATHTATARRGLPAARHRRCGPYAGGNGSRGPRFPAIGRRALVAVRTGCRHAGRGRVWRPRA